MHRSERMLTSTEWLERFENLLGYLTATWDGLIVVTGDINIDLLRPNKPITSQYQFILSSLNLHQHEHKTTRTTDKTSTLIDHITFRTQMFIHVPKSAITTPPTRLLTSKLPDSK